MSRRGSLWRLLTAAAAIVTVAGACSGSKPHAESGRVALGAGPATASRNQALRPDDTAAQDDQPEPDVNRARGLALDGMIGQVNGQPIYVTTVIGDIDAQLGSLGRRLPREQFREEASKLIRSRVEEVVENALVLAEAERDLTDVERRNLKEFMKRRRAAVVRKKGLGSPAVADATLQEETGKSLDQTMNEVWKIVLVQRYVRGQVLATVNVSRQEIERFYRDHEKEFNPPPTRTIRRIKVSTEAKAKDVLRRLEARTPFAEVATSDPNLYKPADGGLMDSLVGDAPFAQETFNIALKNLNEGHFTGPLHVGEAYWFIYLEKVEQREVKPLPEVQLEIGHTIASHRKRKRLDQFKDRLWDKGSYTKVEQMTDVLIEVAINRFGAPEQ